MLFQVLEFASVFSSLFSALFVAFGVLMLSYGLRKIFSLQQRRNTADLIGTYEDQILIPFDAFERVNAEDFASGYEGIDPEKRSKFNEILRYFNSLEHVSIIINSDIVDEGVARRIFFSAIKKSFEDKFEYIIRVRESAANPNLYSEWEALARRWGATNDL